MLPKMFVADFGDQLGYYATLVYPIFYGCLWYFKAASNPITITFANLKFLYLHYAYVKRKNEMS